MSLGRTKARWAAERAEALERQARELARPDLDWRARQRARDGADRLRAEAARFRKLAHRYGGAA